MKHSFQPDYHNIHSAAQNQKAARLPLYEHGLDVGVVEAIANKKIAPLLKSNTTQDQVAGLRNVAEVAIKLGYDCIPYECSICTLIQDGKGLTGQATALIRNMEDLEKYPWDQALSTYQKLYDQSFAALRQALPQGMKAIGGVGYGPFESIQDFVPYEQLIYLQMDQPDVYDELWKRIGEMHLEIWNWLLDNHGDSFAVCRFGDDLGFKSSTLLSPEEIRKQILPIYTEIINLVHNHDKPFLLHSCGNIHDIMDDIIATGIDAKHSNEDAIDTFDVWTSRYGDRIGNFGGVEMNMMTINTPEEVKAYVHALLPKVVDHGGIAIGTGNQISPYTKPENWIAMTEAVREFRGDY
jgi:uroporphyrinogen decarboxylase